MQKEEKKVEEKEERKGWERLDKKRGEKGKDTDRQTVRDRQTKGRITTTNKLNKERQKQSNQGQETTIKLGQTENKSLKHKKIITAIPTRLSLMKHRMQNKIL